MTDVNILLQITREVYGMLKTIELIPNGSQVNVTQQNKLAYIMCLYNSFCHRITAHSVMWYVLGIRY